ncbi:RNA methyltransferase, TrmA family [Coriobacterium glomerans PW2]|uniref:RNA methyltransferase, TrmA family n=2 Tax=Coriobacterium TaxID=33870 RepID=F2N6Y9_CORGP|nr:RNA methyltransferase, TrmA family [Coriobacterium glomerans PW2]
MSRTRPDGPCPTMRTCGGCAWLGIPYLKQLRRKHAALTELFEPLARRHEISICIDPVRGMGADSDSDTRILPPRGFRFKAATPFAPGMCGSLRSGFFARGTHEIIESEDCIVEAPGARRILHAVAVAAERSGVSAYDEDRRRGALRHAVVRLGRRSDEGMLTIVTSGREIAHLAAFVDRLRDIDPRVRTVAQNVNLRATNAILGSETRILVGPPRMRDRLLECDFEISPTAFFQTNPEQTEVLYRVAIEHMALDDGDVVLDAYCGSGTIGLSCAAHMRASGRPIRVIGVERNPAGVRDARRNAEINGLDAMARFVEQDATAYIAGAADAGDRVDVLVLDPPRAGASPELLAAAVRLAPRRIVYISCNPVTQARDLDSVLDAGFRLMRVTPVDMFPHTSHIETVAVLACAAG